MRLDGRSFVAVTAVAIGLLYMACFGAIAQDWWPLHVAGSLVKHGQWDQVYLPANATTLFDVTPAFIRAADGELANAVDRNALTAYLSPPPVAVLFVPLAGHWQLSLIGFRLLLVGFILAAVVLAMRGEPARAHLWAVALVAISPLIAYAVYVGQTAACFLVASTMATIRPTRARDWLGGLALGFVMLTKATPLLLAVAICVAGRKRLGLIAIGSALAVSLATWPWTGVEAWRLFVEAAQRLSHAVITDWPSLSIEATVLRVTRHQADFAWLTPSRIEWIAIWSLRLPLLALAAWTAWRRRLRGAGAMCAVCVGWLAATPILWLSYMLALFPFAVNRSLRRTTILTLLLSGSVLLAESRAAPLVVGIIGSALWLMAAVVLLLNASHQPAVAESTDMDL